MIRAIVWKEIREQGLIGLTLVVLGSGVLAAAAVLAEPATPGAPPADVIRHLGVGLLATLMLAVTAGMVCGGAVFAAEREANTMGFLESLPVSRQRLWLAKFVAGVGLAVVQAGLLVAVAALLGLIPTFGWARAVCVFSLLAFSWGIFGSTLARTTLGSVGVAIPAAVVASVVVLLPIMLFFPAPGGSVTAPRLLGVTLFLVSMFVIPVGLSAWVFAAPDRHRAASGTPGIELAPISAAGGAPPRDRPRMGVTALLWMTTRQLRVPTLVLSGFALVVGLSLLAPGTRPILTWPGLALAAGVLAGVTAFADEQSRGSARFWGEQRLPVGRVWVVKVGFHVLLGLWLLVLLVMPLIIRAQFERSPTSRGRTDLAIVFHSQLFDEIGRNGWKYLVVPAVYGFAAGHLCGLLFRKLAVACGVAGIVGGVGAALWGPSLLAGGVSHWQLWSPPVIALLTARLLIPAWAADRVLTRRPVHTLIVGCLAAALALGAGIGYRVLEIPDRPGGEDDIAYVASLPSIDQNAAGRDFRTAAERYVRAVNGATPRPDAFEPLSPSNPVAVPRGRPDEQFNLVIRDGWERATPTLAPFLDRVLAPPPPVLPGSPPGDPNEDLWHAMAEKAANHPPGIFESPQTLKMSSFREAVQNARRMAAALLARGLKEQAAGNVADWVGRWVGFPLARALKEQSAGNPGVFINDLRTVLALARTMRTGAVIVGFQAGVEIEATALLALDNWLDRLGHSPDHVALLRQARMLLEAADPAEPFDPTPHYLTERYVLREAMKAPAQWLPPLLTLPGGNPEAADAEVDLVGVAWAVPWERERTHRLVGLGFESGPVANYQFITGRPGAGLLIRPRLAGELGEYDRGLRAYRRAAILKVALRAFRIEHGKYPDTLQALVDHRYLGRLPQDPYDENRGFGYRLARSVETNKQDERGEFLRPPARGAGPLRAEGGKGGPNEFFVSAGKAIIWSVGADGVDGGGTSPPANAPLGAARPEDLIYIVPHGTIP